MTDWSGFTEAFANVGSFKGVLLLLSVIGLQFVNYSLEMLKWRESLPIKSIALKKSELLKAVYVGNSFAFVTPNRFGGFIGRFLVVTQIDKIQVTLSTFYGNFIQMVITMLAGSIALIMSMYFNAVSVPFWMQERWFVIALLLVTILFIGMIFNMKIWIRLVEKLNWKLLLNHKEKWTFIANYKWETSLKMLLWASSRYVVFCIQLFLLFQLFKIPLNVLDFYIFIATLYLFTTFIPSALASNVGTREAVALFLLVGLSLDAQIVLSTLFLWLINMVLPALIGWMFLLKISPPNEL